MNFEYTRNNHYKWGWGNDWFNSIVPGEKFKIELGQINRPVESFRQECINTARLIGSAATKPIALSLSGGNDSQVMALSFKEAGVDFTAIIATIYNTNGIIVNSHDTDKVWQFCTNYNIKYQEHKIYLDKFYNTKGIEYAKKYGFYNVESIIHTDIIDALGKNYCYVSGEGKINILPYNNNITPDLNLNKMENGLTVPVWWRGPTPIMQHLIDNVYEGTTSFFMYTPEIILSLLEHPIVSGFLNAQDQLYSAFADWTNRPADRVRLYDYFYKTMVIINSWPEINQRRKYTGFEKMWNNADCNKELVSYQTTLSKCVNKQYKSEAVIIPINDLINHLKGVQTLEFKSTRVVQ
jgi:hypothetical protein